VNWESIEAFFAMGGYGRYVWGSYAVTLALIALEIVMLRVRRKNILKELRQAARRREIAP